MDTEAAKHCPGPWRVVERKNARGQELTPAIVGKRSWGGSREWPIAVAYAISKNETDANARLIAAAPELLAACEAALNDRMFKDWPEVATLLLNAISKARGQPGKECRQWCRNAACGPTLGGCLKMRYEEDGLPR